MITLPMKVDLVSEVHVDTWQAELGRRYPAAAVALFSSKGKVMAG